MTRDLKAELARAVTGEVRFDAGARAAYSADASNYRQVPIGVVLPRSVEDIVAATAVCRARNVPILARGGGTAQNGQSVNVAVVIDCSKYLNRGFSRRKVLQGTAGLGVGAALAGAGGVD